MSLDEFANWLETRRPSELQLKISPGANKLIRDTLEWVICQARMKVDEQHSPNQ